MAEFYCKVDVTTITERCASNILFIQERCASLLELNLLQLKFDCKEKLLNKLEESHITVAFNNKRKACEDKL